MLHISPAEYNLYLESTYALKILLTKRDFQSGQPIIQLAGKKVFKFHETASDSSGNVICVGGKMVTLKNKTCPFPQMMIIRLIYIGHAFVTLYNQYKFFKKKNTKPNNVKFDQYSLNENVGAIG